jgi:hypothetical protein
MSPPEGGIYELYLGLFIALVIILITFAPATPIEPCPSGNPGCVIRNVKIDEHEGAGYDNYQNRVVHANRCPEKYK